MAFVQNFHRTTPVRNTTKQFYAMQYNLEYQKKYIIIMGIKNHNIGARVYFCIMFHLLTFFSQRNLEMELFFSFRLTSQIITSASPELCEVCIQYFY